MLSSECRSCMIHVYIDFQTDCLLKMCPVMSNYVMHNFSGQLDTELQISWEKQDIFCVFEMYLQY